MDVDIRAGKTISQTLFVRLKCEMKSNFFFNESKKTTFFFLQIFLKECKLYKNLYVDYRQGTYGDLRCWSVDSFFDQLLVLLL